MNLRDYIWQQLSDHTPFLFDAWQPTQVAVVVGYSQHTQREVFVDRCRRDGVPILRRRGGGGAVVLMPGIVCITCAFISGRSDSPYYFFRLINQWIIALLQERFQISGLYAAGISDIARGDRKLLGCSMFKSRQTFLYQGSLLVCCDLHLFGRYLKHPSHEPDYRRGRGHEDFLTTLAQEGFRLQVNDVLMAFWSTDKIGELSAQLRSE